jgi:catechol 2,3-dioxygenase-like lactoylglutathione lyase family enzyme
MVSDGKVIAFVATTDATRARAFYEGVLGLRVVGEDDFALTFDGNGTKVRLTKVSDFVARPYTVLGWEVTDIASSVLALRDRGVHFEKYDFFTQDALGVWTAPGGACVAWFKDPDGNVLSLSQL